jgi:polysaccharide biosynthesis transport protein
MDTIDRSDSNLPARFPTASQSLPALGPVFTGDLATTPSSQINSRTILRGLTRHWLLILALWLGVSTPIVIAIYRFVEPTYEAFSTLRIEPTQARLLETTQDNGESRSVIHFLQTQASLLTTDNVLNAAIANPNVVNLPVIVKSEDATTDLRNDLSVEIVDDAYLIRVALELTDGNQAATIVNAVVEAYLSYNSDFNRRANLKLTTKLEEHQKTLQSELAKKRDKLKAIITKTPEAAPKVHVNADALKHEGDAVQPIFRDVDESHVQQMVQEMVKTNLELAEAEAALKVSEEKQAANQANEQANEQASVEDDEQLEILIREEFGKDPEVGALMEAISEMRRERDHSKSVARRNNDPSRRVTEKECKRLEAEYQVLWAAKYKEIRKRLTGAADSSRLPNLVADMQIKVATLRQKQQNQAKLYDKVEGKQKTVNNDKYEAAFLEAEIKGLMKKDEQIEANIEQLKFEASLDVYRVEKVDPATAPKTATNKKYIKYMAAATVGVLFMILGLFMLLEIKAERIDDPDTLSNRVRSEVYALPPLPTNRSMRKLSAVQADDQIDQFIQRLDHLRFAVCGNPAELGKGRCVLITSAIGGEGKTTLAAQLAARCGNAGMSTLLIDADLRRSGLCRLLDVQEGPGLSDVLKDLATIDDVVIPVQGGTFYLLPAGTPIHDNSRVLQTQSVGLLITQLRQLYDLIIIDSPPVLPVPDALILGRWADGAVLAARYDSSRFPQVERARRQLDNAGIAILGTVINGMRNSASYYGRYSYSRQRTSQPNSSETI